MNVIYWERCIMKASFIIFVAIKIAVFWRSRSNFLSTFSTDATGQLDVLGHDGDTFGVDGAQVGVLEESNQVCLGSFLESLDGWSLESQVSLEVLSDLTDKTLEWQLADQKLSGFLVSSDLTKSNCTRSVPMGFLDSTSGWGWLACSLGSQLFSWSFTSGRFSCCLLSTSHFE